MSALRSTLAATGLLRVARYARDARWNLQFLRPNWSYLREGAPDGMPIPPFRLRILVAGSPDIGWFLASGRRGAESICNSLDGAGLQINRVGPILDFGCGCGRVTRHLASTASEVHGSDFNPALVAWCRRKLRFASFAINDLAPPLPYADAQFGLVYALSVFTHLPASLQRPWMDELRRVTRPGGHLLLTTHGTEYLRELSDEQRRQFAAGELVVRHGDRPGSNACGAYHPETYMREQLATGFSVVEFVPKGATGNPWQDRWLLRKHS